MVWWSGVKRFLFYPHAGLYESRGAVKDSSALQHAAPRRHREGGYRVAGGFPSPHGDRPGEMEAASAAWPRILFTIDPTEHRECLPPPNCRAKHACSHGSLLLCFSRVFYVFRKSPSRPSLKKFVKGKSFVVFLGHSRKSLTFGCSDIC